MQKVLSGLPPRYQEILRYTLKAVLVRLLAWVPFCLAYYQPFSLWLRLLALFTPVLWVYAVCPMRVRYAGALTAIAQEQPVSLPFRGLFSKNRPWADVCRGRIRQMRWWSLPLCVLAGFLLLLLWTVDAFSAVKVLINVFGSIAAVITMVLLFIPRLIAGHAVLQPVGILGSVVTLVLVGSCSLILFGWGAFRTSGYRFGYTGKAKKGELKPLLQKNLRLWLPTLVLLIPLLAVSYQELGLLLANLISAAPVFTVKLQWYQIVLLTLTAISYFLQLPLRRLNTANWVYAKTRGE